MGCLGAIYMRTLLWQPVELPGKEKHDLAYFQKIENRTAPTNRDMSGQFGAGLRCWFIFQTATIH